MDCLATNFTPSNLIAVAPPVATICPVAFLLKRHAAGPGVSLLVMSGYPAKVIANQGVLEEGLHFIQKPFGHDALAIKLRAVLQSPAPRDQGLILAP